MRPAAAALVVVMLFALGALAVNVLAHPHYTPDGIVYARYAARYAGEDQRHATLAARAYYERTPLMTVPRYRALVQIEPSKAFTASRIFVNRPLYPWLVSLLLPAAGFRALFIVSAAAYVGFGVALFWLLLALGRPWIAALVAIAALALPLTRSLAGSDLTDMLAAVWWTLAIGALLRGLRKPRRSWIAMVFVASILLALTRPAPYLVVVPALFATALTGSWMLLIASLGGVLAYAGAAAATHAFGAGEQLRWVYVHDPLAGGETFASWYRHALSSTVVSFTLQSVRAVVPVLAVAAAIYASLRTRMRQEMIVLLAALLACLVAIPFNPVPSALARIVMFPLVPVFCAMLVCFCSAQFDYAAQPKRAAA